MEGGVNEGIGEGWPKMVDVFAMPTVFAVAAICRRKTKPAHEGRGSFLPPLPSRPQ
jgi:hypothetical protein